MVKKKLKPSLKKLKKKTWELCRELAALLYPPRCYTCGKPVSGSNKHLGHFIPSSVCGAALRYDVRRNLRWQCMTCNVWLGGNGAVYYRNMVKEVGQHAVDKVFVDKNVFTKADVIFFSNKILELQDEITRVQLSYLPPLR